jgi:uncharacterized peroxidase-related enzyme
LLENIEGVPMSTGRLTTLGMLSEADAPPESRDMMAAVRHNLGMVPNLMAEMAHSPGLLHTYLTGYRQFGAGSGFTTTEREVVYLSVSRFHACTYCVAAHSATADQASVPVEVTNAIRSGTPVSDARLRTLAEFATIMVATRGRPSAHDLAEFLSVGFTERHALEVILAIALKTISNYTNHLFGGTPVDDIWAHRSWVVDNKTTDIDQRRIAP